MESTQDEMNLTFIQNSTSPHDYRSYLIQVEGLLWKNGASFPSNADVLLDMAIFEQKNLLFYCCQKQKTSELLSYQVLQYLLVHQWKHKYTFDELKSITADFIYLTPSAITSYYLLKQYSPQTQIIVVDAKMMRDELLKAGFYEVTYYKDSNALKKLNRAQKAGKNTIIVVGTYSDNKLEFLNQVDLADKNLKIVQTNNEKKSIDSKYNILKSKLSVLSVKMFLPHRAVIHAIQPQFQDNDFVVENSLLVSKVSLALVSSNYKEGIQFKKQANVDFILVATHSNESDRRKNKGQRDSYLHFTVEGLEELKVEKGDKYEHKQWILYAILTGLTFMMANFCGAEISKGGPVNLVYQWPGLLICTVFYFSFLEIFPQMKPQNDSIFQDKDDKFSMKIVLLMLFLALLFQANEGLYLWMFQVSKDAQLNIGVPSSIVSITPLFVAIIERIYFKTPLTITHLFAFIILSISSSCISLSKELEQILLQYPSNTMQQISNSVSNYIPVAMATMITILSSVDVILQKYSVMTLRIDPLLQSFVRFLIISIVLMFISIYYYSMIDFNPYYLAMGICSGIFLGISKVLLNYNVKIGPAGQIFAILNTTYTITLVMLQAARLNQRIRFLELIGTIVSILGCVVFAYNDKIEQFFKPKK